MKIKITGARVYDTDRFTQRDLLIENDRIVDVFQGDGETEVIEASDKLLLPGLVDVHFHGCVGADFCDGSLEALEKIATYECSQGVMTILPTSMTLPKEELNKIFATAAAFAEEQNKAWAEKPEEAAKASDVAGIHMEGPYIAEARKGAQKKDYLQIPNGKDFEELQTAAKGLIRLLSLAPEVENALNFIRDYGKDVHMSIAHTDCEYETAMAAFAAGADHVTHTFNAMKPFLHRAPGVVGAAGDAHAFTELICDGIHLQPSVIRAAVKIFGKDRVVLISDSMMGTGLPDGMYALGGQPVKKTGAVAALADGTIAGSVTNLFDCMRQAVRFGIPLCDAVRFASENPAASVGLKEVGTLQNGKYANVIITDSDLNIRGLIHRGVRMQ